MVAPAKPNRSTLAVDAANEVRSLDDADLALFLTQFRRLTLAPDDDAPEWLTGWDTIRLDAAEKEWCWRKRAEQRGGPGVARSNATERLADLKARVDLAELVMRRVKLRRSGQEWVGLCPAHSENTPSFHVNHERMHCFGCGLHGDVIRWVEMFEVASGDFKDAVRWLEERS